MNNTKNNRAFYHGDVPEGWEVKKLEDELESLDAGVSVNSTDEDVMDNDLCILKTSAVSNGIFNPKECKKILPADRKRARLNPQEDSIIISRMNTPDLVGECGYVDRTYSNIFLPDRLWQTKFHSYSKIYPKWLNYLLNTTKYKLRIKGTATGTSNSMKNISKGAFLKLKIAIPPLPEQRAIAACLGAWDEAIQKTTQLIAQKELRKKWLMQQLLTGKTRLKGFEGEWREYHIRDIATELSKKNSKEKDLIVLSCTKYDGLVPSLEYFGRRVFSEDTSSYKVVPKYYFAYATNHIEEGSIGYQDNYEEALISPMYTVFKTSDSINDYFLFKLLKSHRLIHEYNARMEGSIDRRGGLRWDAFSIIKIRLPSLPEQTAIAQVLQTADREIELLKAKVVQLKEQKRGLMQVLLTGKVRMV